MNYPYLDKDCKFSKEVVIAMYNDLNEHLGFVERALDMREHELAVLKGEIEEFPLE